MKTEVKIAKCRDLLNIPMKENGEDRVSLNKYDKTIMFGYTGHLAFDDENSDFFVRDTVARKLAKINQALRKKNDNFRLFVAYAYRSLEIQTSIYNEEFLKAKEQYPDKKDEELREICHKKIAYPKVAGHPTGGAVDVGIFDAKLNKFLDFGGEVDDFDDERTATFSEGLTPRQRENRKMLLDLMQSEEFCPFYEEWWHFSYGDKEWAYFYNKAFAIYDQISKKKIFRHV